MSLRHIQCPACASRGKDTRGDNLTVYPDDSTFCFACGYYTTAKEFTPPTKLEVPSPKLASLPPSAITALRHHLTYAQIEEHFGWDEDLGRVVLKDSLPDYYWGKKIHPLPRETKVLTYGERPFIIFGENYKDYLFVVEDPISALVIGQRYGAVPLWGSTFPDAWSRCLVSVDPKTVIFWLDYDKEQESMMMAMSFRHLFRSHFIVTPQDPKTYTVAQIEAKVKQIEAAHESQVV